MKSFAKYFAAAALVCLCGATYAQSVPYYSYQIPERASVQDIHAPEIPEHVVFADDTISLTRNDLRERFDRELLAFSFMHSTTILLIKRANLYFPIIEPILKEKGIPDDFKYLALIESYFNPRAVSFAKAAGIWQFTAATAVQYGLEVSEQVDERFNLEKATAAACDYLQKSYELYNDWVTAAASYNVGVVRISTELEAQHADTSLDLYLNEETSRYVFRILAAKELLSHPQKYGFHLHRSDFYHTVRTENVEVNTCVESWADWAEQHNTTYAQLRYFNMWIRDKSLANSVGKTYVVKVPLAEDLPFDEKKIFIHSAVWCE